MQINSYLAYVNRLSVAEADRVIRLYADAEKQILSLINSGLLNPYQVNALKDKLNEAQKILGYLNNGSKQWTEEMTSNMYGTGVKFATITAGIELSEKILASKFHLEAMNVLANNIYERFDEITGIVGRRINDIYRSISLEFIKSNVAGFDTLRNAAKNIRENLASQGITGFVDKAGKQWDMTNYSDMVARTTSMDVFRQATANEYLRDGIDLVQFNTAVSSATCDACKRWIGETVSLTGKTPGYPTLQKAIDDGMLHPRCIHSYHVVLPNIEAVNKQLQEVG
jgi:hypothetical protein